MRMQGSTVKVICMYVQGMQANGDVLRIKDTPPTYSESAWLPLFTSRLLWVAFFRNPGLGRKLSPKRSLSRSRSRSRWPPVDVFPLLACCVGGTVCGYFPSLSESMDSWPKRSSSRMLALALRCRLAEVFSLELRGGEMERHTVRWHRHMISWVQCSNETKRGARIAQH